MASSLKDLADALVGAGQALSDGATPDDVPPIRAERGGWKQLLTNVGVGTWVSFDWVTLGPDDNAVLVYVIPGGASPAASLTVQDSYDPVVAQTATVDPAGTQSSLTASTTNKYLVTGVGPFITVKLVVTAGTWSVIVVPTNAASQQSVQLAAGTASIGTVTTTPTAGTLTNRSGTITVGGTAQQLMAANASRKYLFIQNLSTENMWINLTTTATTGQPSIKLLPNGVFSMEGAFVSTESVSVIAATTGSAYTAKEA